MKVCVFGAGAIGGFLAVCLHKGGVRPSVIARGPQLEAIRSRGIKLRRGDEETAVAVEASDDPAALGAQDVVFVTVKAPALPSVAAMIGPLLGPETSVVFAMNGIPWWYFYRHGGPLDGRRLSAIDPDDGLWRAIGPDRVIGGVIYSASEVTEPGVVTARHGNSRLFLGEPDSRETERVAVLADILSRGGLKTTVTRAIRDEIWTKLMNNIASGPMAVLTQCCVSTIAAEPACEIAMRMIIEETASIAEALGCHPDRDIDGKIAFMRKLDHKPSILQDLEHGRAMEVEALYGATLTLARMAGVKTPNLELWTALATLRTRAAGLI